MRKTIVPLILAMSLAAPAHGEVAAQSANGFVIKLGAQVAASPEQSWRMLIAPAQWWSKAHTYSQDAANLSLDPRSGGCFCERIPGDKGATRGGVVHMRVVYFEKAKALRLKGALGPLQSEAIEGTLTVTLKPEGAGTRIDWEYVVGGYMRFKPAEIAPAVDKVLGEQLASLAARLGVVR
jgi:uncharacterized protein YndB with AHSA1/START domain